MSRSTTKPLFSKPRAGKLSPNRSNRPSLRLDNGKTRDVIEAADTFFRKCERALPVRSQGGGRA